MVNPVIENQGWSFEPAPGVVADPVMDASYLHELYARADPHYTSKVTVPLLWDLERQTIVSNESADIMRMFNSAFDGITGNGRDYYPAAWAKRIDALNARIYHSLNNGVYRAGFAASQQAYDEAVFDVFSMLDELEETLCSSRFLLGETICETDWRCFTTLVRFDSVYHGLFKCNLRRLADYPRLWRYARELYQQEGIAQTVNFDHIKRHYWCSHRGLNPSGIVPVGPELGWSL